ncbi:hypothetical protein I3760_03G086000 [Carya illinoinensis]|nr:hypothetical protein I3760_03G086000 [Carya illinoinensis]KAG6660254.1 hypothetical protein CIPAW_03G092600 [Carya illinoinensis]KAG6720962.1 hypothetical protein I3842_03G088600 [Carya illinoinensis]
MPASVCLSVFQLAVARHPQSQFDNTEKQRQQQATWRRHSERMTMGGSWKLSEGLICDEVLYCGCKRG